jgi:CheY-like chemotaxis protein
MMTKPLQKASKRRSPVPAFVAMWSTNLRKALDYAKLQDVHALVIDCMLPKMNGLELVKKLKQTLSTEPHLFLISGIFKDKQFINSSLQKTGAVAFMTKPFALKDLVKKLEGLASGIDEDTDTSNTLTRLYLDREMSSRKKLRMINGAQGLHNFDLPWIFQLLLESKATGHLNIACTNGDIAGVGFIDGRIVQVNIKNESSLLGLCSLNRVI